MAKRIQEASLTALGVYTDPVQVVGYFNVSISGTWVGTLSLQRSFDNGVNYFETDTFAINTQSVGLEPEDSVLYRIGFTAFTSGQADVRISQ